jgi:hypothetical protein
MSRTHTLILLDDLLTVCRLPADAVLPAWAQGDAFLVVVRTTDELSIVCWAEGVPANITAEPGWRAFKIQGPLVFSEVGVLASIANPLANIGISIFAISTFETDYILVKRADLENAVTVLLAAGHTIMTMQGEVLIH